MTLRICIKCLMNNILNVKLVPLSSLSFIHNKLSQYKNSRKKYANVYITKILIWSVNHWSTKLDSRDFQFSIKCNKCGTGIIPNLFPFEHLGEIIQVRRWKSVTIEGRAKDDKIRKILKSQRK